MYDYGEICPISKATQILCERWTLQIVREIFFGASRFSEFQKFLPKISPSLLTARLKMLADNGIVIRRRTPEKRGFEYHLTPAGKQLKPVLDAMGAWGMTWIFESLSDVQMQVSTLMRDIAVRIDVDQLPDCDAVVQITFTDIDEPRKRFILIHDGKRETCDENPGYEVDVYLRSTLGDLSRLWWGETSVPAAIESGQLRVTGQPAYTRNISNWLPQSTFAHCNPRRLPEHAGQ